MHRFITILSFMTLTYTVFSQRIKWEVDTVFSEITFDVNHLIFSNVEGEFFGFDGLAYADSSDFSDIKITFVLYPKYLKTDNEVRDQTLKSNRFMDVDQYKTIVFTSTKMGVNEQGDSIISGNLMMFGEKKPVDLFISYLGRKKDMFEREVAEFEINGLIYPSKWGWHSPPFVSKKVKMQGRIRLIKIGKIY